MPILLLVLFGLAALPTWPAPLAEVTPADCLLATAWLHAVPVLFVALHGVRTRHALRRDPVRGTAALFDDRKRRHKLLLVLFAAQAVSLYALGWGWAVQALWQSAGHPWPGIEWVRLAPFALGILFNWTQGYATEVVAFAVHKPADATARFASLPAYLLFQARQQFFVALAAPLGVKLLLDGLFWLVPTLAAGWVGNLLSAAAMVAMVLFAPLGLPWLFDVIPMPAGPVRDRLDATARRLNMKIGRLYLWRTRNSIANALVAGLIPGARLVLLSDRLVNDLLPEELDAVLGHELGHVYHRHIPLYAAFVMLTVTAVGLGVELLYEYALQWEAVSGWRLAHPGYDAAAAYLATGAVLFVAFGWLSRRCERQADLFGCRAVSCGRPDCVGHDPEEPLPPDAGPGAPPCPTATRIFRAALGRVSTANGMDRDRPGWLSSWLHGTIGQRQAYLERVEADPAAAPRFQRRARRLAGGVVAALVAGIGTLVWVSGWEALWAEVVGG